MTHALLFGHNSHNKKKSYGAYSESVRKNRAESLPTHLLGVRKQVVPCVTCNLLRDAAKNVGIKKLEE